MRLESLEPSPRVASILATTAQFGVYQTDGLINAFCSCLNVEEACELLLETAVGNVDLRHAVLRRVCAQMDADFTTAHARLVEVLLEDFSSADSRRRQSLGSCLSTLSRHSPRQIRQRILLQFLGSKYKGIRSRAYKELAKDSELLLDAISKVWRLFKDPDCAILIVKTFPVEFLVDNREDLIPALQGWAVARLYMRVSDVDLALLSELEDSDVISYCYVMAKLKRSIPTEEAVELAKRMEGDERFGLLLWSFGQMGLWEALKYVETSLSFGAARDYRSLA